MQAVNIFLDISFRRNAATRRTDGQKWSNSIALCAAKNIPIIIFSDHFQQPDFFLRFSGQVATPNNKDIYYQIAQ